MENNKTKHLDMISTVINRMATNSLDIKGLLVTIIASVLTFKFNKFEEKLLFLILGITIIFVIFGCYYLLLEKRFRKHFNNVRNLTESDIDFNMSTKYIKINPFVVLV